jgi:6-phosphogluconolactonase
MNLLCDADMTRLPTNRLSKAGLIAASLFSSVLAACGGSGNDIKTPTPVAQLFVQTNDTANAVLPFIRNANGTLTAEPPVSTGGKGTDGVNYFMGGIVAPDALTSNRSVIVSPDGTLLFVANAGDNTVSVFSVNGNSAGITLLAVSPTAATRPTSLAYLNGILYVTNQQGAHELGAYHVGSDGKPTQIGQYAVVQQDALPTQVTVIPDGKYVVVNGF